MKVNINPEEFIEKYWPYGLMIAVAILILVSIFVNPITFLGVIIILALFVTGLACLLIGFIGLICCNQGDYYYDVREGCGCIFLGTALVIIAINIIKMAVFGA